MSVFVRRFLSDPGEDVLLEIESVNILDLDPPASIAGVGTGTVCIVGEFENGPFETVTEVADANDMVATFGSLGYTYNGVVANNPCARSRKSDAAPVAEFWNGNGFVQLSGKLFSRLLICRVDTSVGIVQFNRQAFLVGAGGFSFPLSPGQILSLDDGSGPTSATFNATAAIVTGSGGTFPTTFAGGETLTIGFDAQPNFTVTFLAADQSAAQVATRINQYAGFTLCDTTGGNIRLTSVQLGTGAQIRVVSGSSGVLTKLGLVAGTTFGGGNVANIAAVTPAEVKAIVEAAVSGTSVRVQPDGHLRISKVFSAVGDYIAVGSATTATALGFTFGMMASNDGIARLRSGAETFPTTFAGGETLTLGVDNQPNVTVTFQAGDQSQAQVISRINAAMGFTCASVIDATHTMLQGQANGGEIRVIGGTTLALTQLGLVAATIIDAAPITAGTIPAGTVVRDTGSTKLFVTMQDIAVTTASGGPYSVKVRHATDDGTGVSASAATITVVDQPIAFASFAVTNPALINAALTESQIDAMYTEALGSTVDINTVAKEINIIYSARQSNTIRKQLRSNVLDASANGCFGRMCILRTPMNTPKTIALSTTAEPGVGAYRDQRVIYTYPNVNTFVPLIARRGALAGGAGFTDDGNIDVGADGFLATCMSQLAPEENPGQETTFTSNANGIETGANVQGFKINDYKAFKAAGICAPRMSDGVLIYQSGVTSVDPLVNPELVNIARRRMADFIQDSIAQRAKSYGKKLSTFARRKALAGEIRMFLRDLLSPNKPENQRIDGFTVDTKVNTQTSLGKGIFRVKIIVRTLASLDSIVLDTTIGNQVTVDEVLPQAA